jgi:hypothetical protein
MAPARGQNTVEYALLIAAIIIAIALGVFWFGAAIQAWFTPRQGDDNHIPGVKYGGKPVLATPVLDAAGQKEHRPHQPQPIRRAAVSPKRGGSTAS